MDKIIRLYSRLSALKQNLPQNFHIHEKYIKEYHLIVDELSAVSNLNLDEFKIPTSEVKPYVAGYSPSRGTMYSKENHCEKTYVLSKVDALLMYFQMTTSKEKENIGFKPPNQ